MRIILSILVVCALNACSDPIYTFRCNCTKVAYLSDGQTLDESFNQTVCDTTENIDTAFKGELSTLSQECAQHFDVSESDIESTDCFCECELLGECN